MLPVTSACGLSRRLSEVAAPALLHLFEADDRADAVRARRYVAFVDHLASSGLADLFDAFPMQRMLLTQTVDQWLDGAGELAERTASDIGWLSGSASPGAVVVGIEDALGDRHRGGRTVHRIDLSDGRTIIYKPRPMVCEARFFELTAWFRQQAGIGVPLPRVADRGEYGWMDLVTAAPCATDGGYWRRAGELVALLHLSGAEDMHHENLIAGGDDLVPVDLECIDQPDRLRPWRTPRSVFAADSVLATGLFPGVHREGGPVAREISGLLGRPGRTNGIWHRRWVGLGTDAIGRERYLGDPDPAANLARTEAGDLLPVDLGELIAGFDTAVEVVSADASPAARLGADAVAVPGARDRRVRLEGVRAARLRTRSRTRRRSPRPRVTCRRCRRTSSSCWAMPWTRWWRRRSPPSNDSTSRSLRVRGHDLELDDGTVVKGGAGGVRSASGGGRGWPGARRSAGGSSGR